MTEQTLPYKATLKSGGGYDAPWITVDGATAADLANNLDALVNSGAVQKVVQAASLFQGALVAGPLAEPAQAPVQQQSLQSPPAQQPQWSQPQQAAPQQQGGNRPGAQLHPEGKACDQCGTTLEFKKTQTGKSKWQCPQWRWNNGNPNGHSSEWVN